MIDIEQEVRHALRSLLDPIDPAPSLRPQTAKRARIRRVSFASLAGLTALVTVAVASWGALALWREPSENPPSSITTATFSVPEGSLVLQTASGTELLQAGEEGSRSLGSGMRPLDLSPDGSRILGQLNDELVAMAVDSGHREVLVSTPEEQSLGGFTEWSPDGTMVAYDVGADPPEEGTLCVLTLSPAATRCFPEAGRVYTFDWSPDGKRLVVAGPGSQPVYFVDASTGNVSVGVAQRGDTPINERLRSEGLGESVQLVGTTWSPSGRFLAGIASLEGSDYVYVPVVFTPEGKPVTFGQPSGEFPEQFAWSPHEDLLVYKQGEAPYRITEAYVLDPATDEDRHVVSSGGKRYPIITDLVWSPSGQWIAFSLWDIKGDRETVTLRIVDVDSGDAQETEIDAGGVTEPLVDWGP